MINNISSIQIESWFTQVKSKLRQIKIKKTNYYIFRESDLLSFLKEAPKFEQPILQGITKNIARQLIELEETYDWDKFHIAKIAGENWPQLNIHTPNAIIGEILIRKSHSVLINKF